MGEVSVVTVCSNAESSKHWTVGVVSRSMNGCAECITRLSGCSAELGV